jgi:hypothetical protein
MCVLFISQRGDAKRCAAVDELFPDRLEYNAINRAVTEEDRHFLRGELLAINHSCPMAWLLSDEPQVKEERSYAKYNIIDMITNAKSCIFSEIAAEFNLTEEEMTRIEDVTKGQVKNVTWNALRCHRVTASNFGRILQAISRNTYPPSLFKQIQGSREN